MEESKELELTPEQLEELQEQLGEDNEEYVTGEELLNQIAAQEELKRISIQDDPISEVPEDVENSDLYKKITSQAHIIGESLQILLGYGLDYSNALSISNNLIQNVVETEKVRIQGVTIQQSQI
jgi:ribosomal protein L20A (L18A)